MHKNGSQSDLEGLVQLLGTHMKKEDSVENLGENSAKNAMLEFFRISELATLDIGDICKSLKLSLSVAESCTGGLLGGAITQVSGVSAWFNGGFLTYNNSMKEHVLDVEPAGMAKYGAVSALTVCQMAAGACRKSSADIGLAISGIAGPDGGTKNKPVGTVWVGLALPKELQAKKQAHIKTNYAAEQLSFLDALASREEVSNRDYSWVLSSQLLKNAFLLRETPVLVLDEREILAREFCFDGDRTSIRQSAVLMALYFAYEYLNL